jgi:hypothetical protein
MDQGLKGTGIISDDSLSVYMLYLVQGSRIPG